MKDESPSNHGILCALLVFHGVLRGPTAALSANTLRIALPLLSEPSGILRSPALSSLVYIVYVHSRFGGVSVQPLKKQFWRTGSDGLDRLA